MIQLPARPSKLWPHSLDRVALTFILALVVAIGGLLLLGNRGGPRVRDFNWQDKQVGAVDTAFVLTFSRPMNQASVEKNLQINPPLPGKFSWAGRRMVYTLNFPAPYGQSFQVQLQNGEDQFQSSTYHSKMQPFSGSFRTRDRAFAYIGTEGAESGRLVLYNLTTQKKQVLTPVNLIVFDFKPYPMGDRILFSAADRSSQTPLVDQKLYTVSTGISINPPKALDDSSGGVPPVSQPSDPGQIVEILDNRNYQNLQFDLSADGQTIVVQRVGRTSQSQATPWILRSGQDPKPLKLDQPSGDFLITADGKSLVLAQGQGLSILPLQDGSEPPSFLPKFGTVLSFAQDNSAAAMVKFNTDYTKSLYLVSDAGEKEILKTTGSIQSALFDPTKQFLYCLLTELIPGPTYQEQPYLAAIDLKLAQTAANPNDALRPLLRLPKQREIQVSLAPDSVALLFDQKLSTDPSSPTPDGQLWLLPLTTDLDHPLPPEQLPLPGVHPRWML